MGAGMLHFDAFMVVKGQFCWVCGQDRDGPLFEEGKLLLGHAPAVRWCSGTADKSLVRPAKASAAAGYGVRPSLRASASVDGAAKVGVYLPGHVTLETADDLHLRKPFFEATFDIGLGRLVRSHTGENDAP